MAQHYDRKTGELWDDESIAHFNMETVLWAPHGQWHDVPDTDLQVRVMPDDRAGTLRVRAGRKYAQLLRDQRKLRALEAGGVDNWEGYGIAMEPLWADEEAEQVEFAPAPEDGDTHRW